MQNLIRYCLCSILQNQCQFLSYMGFFVEPAIAAMHGPHDVFGVGHYTVIHCDAGGVSLVDQWKAEKN